MEEDDGKKSVKADEVNVGQSLQTKDIPPPPWISLDHKNMNL